MIDLDKGDIEFLANRLGECTDNKNECSCEYFELYGDKCQINNPNAPLTPDEYEFWRNVDGEEYSYFVQLPDGRRGAMFLDEWINDEGEGDDPAMEDDGVIMMGVDAYRKVWDEAATLIEGFGLESAFGKYSGPCGRTEVAMFVPTSKSFVVKNFPKRVWEAILAVSCEEVRGK